MIKDINNKLYLKQTYCNAGKVIMEKNLKHFKKYINYHILDNYIYNIKKTTSNSKIYINDKENAFFDMLCRKLICHIFFNETVFLIMSSSYISDVIICLYVPEKNIIISNTEKSDKEYFYNINIDKKIHNNFMLANDFFEKSKKI